MSVADLTNAFGQSIMDNVGNTTAQFENRGWCCRDIDYSNFKITISGYENSIRMADNPEIRADFITDILHQNNFTLIDYNVHATGSYVVAVHNSTAQAYFNSPQYLNSQ